MQLIHNEPNGPTTVRIYYREHTISIAFVRYASGPMQAESIRVYGGTKADTARPLATWNQSPAAAILSAYKFIDMHVRTQKDPP
jgi:hypothetical protein